MNPLRAFLLAITDPGIAHLPPFEALTLGKVVPLRAPYTYDPAMTIADVTVSDFPGSAGIVQDDVPDGFTDPVTGDYIMIMIPPAGGWRWTSTGTTNLPQQITGLALVSADGATLYAVSDPLTPPVDITESGQGWAAGELGFRLTLAGITPYTT